MECIQYLKYKLQGKYHETIFNTEIKGKSDVLLFWDNASEIIGKCLDERKLKIDESRLFVVTAVRLLISGLLSEQ